MSGYSNEDRLMAARTKEAMAIKARTDPAIFAEFVLRDEKTGKPIESAPLHYAWHDAISDHDRVVLVTGVESGKRLRLDTPMPTPDGRSITMGEVSVGDEILDSDGAPCRVTKVWPVTCEGTFFKMTLADGAVYFTGGDHQWVAITEGENEVVDTDTMYARMATGWNPRIPTASREFGPDRSVRVASLEPIDAEPARCISVDSWDHTYLIGDGSLGYHHVTHNSQQLTVARALWDLGRNPRERILIVSKRKDMAVKFTASMNRLIQSSEELKMVFPNLRPMSGPGGTWQKDRFIVERTGKGDAKDYSVEAAGLDANKLGSRYTRIYIDDLIDFESTWTEYQREKTLRWLESTLFGRLDEEGKILFIGNPWHEKDAIHMLGKRKNWVFIRAGAVKDKIDADTFVSMSRQERERLHLTWPARWSLERIQKFIDDFGITEANRQVFAITPKAGGGLFKEAWVQSCMERGVGRSFRYAMSEAEIPDDSFISIGVDLASRKGKKNDQTAFVVFLVHPPAEGSDLQHGDLELLWIETGKYSAPEIKKKIVELNRRYARSTFTVEDVGAQIYIAQDLLEEHPDIVVHNFTTTARSKWSNEYGLGGFASQFERGAIIIPAYKTTERIGDGEGHFENNVTFTPAEPIIRTWVNEVKSVSRDEHTGDIAMASLMARYGARNPPFAHGWAITYTDPMRPEAEPLVAGSWIPDNWKTLTPDMIKANEIMTRPRLGDDEKSLLKQVADRFGFMLDVPLSGD